MKRTTLTLLVLAVAVAAFAGAGIATASHCASSTTVTETTHDPFGSCEDGGATYGNVRCGAGTDVPMLATVIVANNSSGAGVQVCNDTEGNPATGAVQGRVSVYRASNGDVLVASDGDGTSPPTPASWSRVDVRPGGTGTTPSQNCTASNSKVQVRRGSGGSYWDGSGGTRGNDSGNYCLQP